jgi:hypothetical protein
VARSVVTEDRAKKEALYIMLHVGRKNRGDEPATLAAKYALTDPHRTGSPRRASTAACTSRACNRPLTVLEHPDDRPLDPVVSAMPASDGGLRSLDVTVVGTAVVAIEIPACSETAV